MGRRTKIDWLYSSDGKHGSTWNWAIGCSEKSAGCKNCYAKGLVNRFPHLTGVRRVDDECGDRDYVGIGWDGKAHFNASALEEPFRWRMPRKVLSPSMSDPFHESLTNEQIAAAFGVMSVTPHTYFVLTKRIDRAVNWETWVSCESKRHDKSTMDYCKYVAGKYTNNKLVHERSIDPWMWPLKNVWMGVSVENQDEMWRVDELARISAHGRFVSFEPLLGGIDLSDSNAFFPQEYTGVEHMGVYEMCVGEPKIDWCIVGAETGNGKRPFKDEWALDIGHTCLELDIPFFFKKDGSGEPTLCGVEYREWPDEIAGV